MRIKNISGQKFGCITVLDDHISVACQHGTKIKWKCVCDCGNEMYMFTDAIVRSEHKWCKQCRPNGVRHTKLYHVYYGILQRCYNPRNPSYSKYGARGITMCDEWRASYQTFLNWATAHGYSDGLTIDRIDSSAGYNPENCRWISLSENSARANIGLHKNKTKLKDLYAVAPDGTRYDFDNVKHFADEHGLNYSSLNAILHGRMCNSYCGWTFHSNLTTSNFESVTTIEHASIEKNV